MNKAANTKTPAQKRPKAALSELMFELGRLMKQQMGKSGYGPSLYLHLETLRFLTENEGADMQDIAAYLRIAAPSATGLVDALVAQKLVVRLPDPSDRRRVVISVSSKGTLTLAKAAKHRAAAFARVTAALSARDAQELVRILSIITKQH